MVGSLNLCIKKELCSIKHHCILVCELHCTPVETMCFYKFKLLVVVYVMLQVPLVNRSGVWRLPIKISVDCLPCHSIVGVVFTAQK